MKTKWIIFLAVLATSAAHADKGTWAKSFTADAAGSYLDGKPRVLVAAVGEDEASEAAASLRSALRASGRAKLVLDDSALGELTNVKDPAVVKKAAKLPVDVIAVLRVFDGDKATAVAIFYDKKGNTLAALSVEKGAPLGRRGEAGSGVSSETESAVSRVLHDDEQKKEEPPAPKDPREQEYDRRHIGFYRDVTVNLFTGQAWGNWGGPYRGDGEQPLDAPSYFHTVGRDDLASYYRSGTRTKTALGVTGGILITGGVATALTSIALTTAGLCEEQDTSGDCIKRDMTSFATTIGVGLGALVIGVVEAVIAGKTHRFRTGVVENYKMGAEYNRRLREELGLPPKKDEDVPDDVQQPEQPPTAQLSLTPVISPQAGGVAVGVRF